MIVIAKRFGQLGNRLWLHAHFIAAARHYGVELRNPSLCEYASLFPSTRGDLWCKFYGDQGSPARDQADRFPAPQPSPVKRRFLAKSIETGAKVADLMHLRHRPAKIIRLGKNESCDLGGDRFASAIESKRMVVAQGWAFRGKEFVNNYQNEIREYFRLDADDQERVDRSIAKARRDSDLLIGVHIRRGDYAKFLGGKYYFENPEYARWMHQVKEHFAGSKVNFLVCSDEQISPWSFPGLMICPGPGAALLDMYALGETDFIIGPPSTFASWAAFVGEKPLMHLQDRAESVVVPDLKPIVDCTQNAA